MYSLYWRVCEKGCLGSSASEWMMQRPFISVKAYLVLGFELLMLWLFLEELPSQHGGCSKAKTLVVPCR